jgi:hypothetical protein
LQTYPLDEQLTMHGPAYYKIVVHGSLNHSWSSRLGGMSISKNKYSNKEVESILIGQLLDQAALSGVLNALYEMHLPVISVELLDAYRADSRVEP